MPSSTLNTPELLDSQSLRAANMAKRKSAILFHAGQMIAREGFEALKIRDLAERSGVTAPTIYNLIGGKPEILSLIIEDLVGRLQETQQDLDTDDIEEAFEKQIENLAALFQADQDFYRAAFIAGDRSGLFEQSSSTGIFARSLKPTIDLCKKARKVNLLKGEVSSEQLGRQIYGCYRLARQDWVNGYFDLAGFRKEALTGIYLCLAADAAPSFHKRLMQRIRVLKKQQ